MQSFILRASFNLPSCPFGFPGHYLTYIINGTFLSIELIIPYVPVSFPTLQLLVLIISFVSDSLSTLQLLVLF